MFLEIIISCTIGITLGTITGLTPGIHINLVSIILLKFIAVLLLYFNPLSLAVIIVSMGITHSFLDSIPAIYLGAPDSDTVLNVLPGHKLLLQGKGYEAVKLTLIGSLMSLITVTLFIPILLQLTPIIFEYIEPYIGYILLTSSILMILREEKKLLAFHQFLITGILGIIVLSLPLKQPLLPMLSGLFGTSGLLISMFDKVVIPKQIISETIQISKKNKLKAIFASSFAGTLTGIFPGLGAAQAAIIGSSITGHIGNYTFLILVGGVNTANFLFSLVTFYTLQKSRNGAVLVVSQIINTITIKELIILIATALLAGSIATLLALKIAKVFSKVITKINYQYLCISIILTITLISFLFSGPLGLVILIISTIIGTLPPKLGIGRNHSMGCLLIPVILYFL